MKKYNARALSVDLTNSKFEIANLPDNFVQSFLGGYGLNCRIGYDLIEPKTDPFSDKNPIIIGAGPITGTSAPGSSKTSVLTKFPLSGAVTNAVGGCRLGVLLRMAGYSNMMITGKAESPVYLRVFDDEVQICDASSLIGKDINETTDLLWKKHGTDHSVMTIGEAGENQVAISLALVDKMNTIGKGGLGGVMGSKNLKAIVVGGTKGIAVHDPKDFFKITKELLEKMIKDPDHEKSVTWGKMSRYYGWAFELGWGYQNYRKNCPKEILDLYSPDVYEKRAKKYRAACPSCPSGCKDVLEVKEGGRGGIELFISSIYGRLQNWGSRCNVGDYANLAKCMDFSNRTGLCVHTITGLIDLSVDLFQNGVITKEDTDGLELKWDFPTTFKLLRQTSMKEGFGAVLADGYYGLIKKFGKEVEKHAIHTKGVDIMADPRFNRLNAQEFYIVVNPRGGSQSKARSESYFQKFQPMSAFRQWAERTGIPQKDFERIFYAEDRYHISRLAKHAEDWSITCESLGVPCFERRINSFYTLQTLTDLLRTATGIDMAPQDLKKVGERSVNLERMLNVREGFGRKDDRFPERWFEPVMIEGKEQYALTYFYDRLTKELAYQLLDDYYDERGWDIPSGIPRLSTLERLGLSNVVLDLESKKL